MAETLTQKQERILLQNQQLVAEAIPGADVSPGSAIYELAIKAATAIIADEEQSLDTLRNNMSLVQVLNQSAPDPTQVDMLLSNYNVVRKQGMAAGGMLNIYTRANSNLSIPGNSVFVCNGVEISPIATYVGYAGTRPAEDTETLIYVPIRDLGNGLFVFTISAQTLAVTTATLSAGQVCTQQAPSSRISKVEIASTFTGGTVQETTSALLARAGVGPSARVTTGKDNIKSLLTSNTAVPVLDCAVFGMGDPLLLRANQYGVSGGSMVDVYVKTQPVPVWSMVPLTGTRQPDDSWLINVPADAYPGVYGVLNVYYGGNRIDTSLTPVIGFTRPDGSPFMTVAADARFSAYQTYAVRFTTDIAIAGTTAIFTVELLYSYGVGTLQDFMNTEAIRSYAFDTLIKGVIPVVIEVDGEVRYPQGLTMPTLATVQSVVADAINGLPVGTEALQASEIVYALKYLIPQGEVRMPLNLFARTWLPDGSTMYSSAANYIRVPDLPGISHLNCAFCCYPGSVKIALTEQVAS